MNAARRQALQRLGEAGVAAAAMATGFFASAGSDAPRRAIEIEARRFRFTPSEIRVRRGEGVVLMVTAIDFTHGFSLPDFGVRRDLVPGQAVAVTLDPDRVGRFTFLCDNFCGGGHEDMNGTLVVEA